MALLSGAALLLGLAVVNPDAWIARHNVDRYEATGKVDWSYLRGLSLDAAPTLVALPPEQAACALGDISPEKDTWAGWNLARARARDALADFDLPASAGCSEVVRAGAVTYAGRVRCRPRVDGQLFDGLFDGLPDGVVIADADGIVTTVERPGAQAARRQRRGRPAARRR